MSDQPSAPDLPVTLVVTRLTYLAGDLATDPTFSTVVLNRLMYLVTGYDDPFHQEHFHALVSGYRSKELDVVILRAVADALEASEAERVNPRSEGDV